jgi:hypothetical protein
MAKQQSNDYSPENELNDIHGIDLDIGNLVQKYIVPIDQYRSHNAPIVTGSPDQHQLTSSLQPQESRCHAFYRILGLPVIEPGGNLFSPGYNPLLTGDETDRNNSISSKIPINVKNIVSQRESSARDRLSRFAIQNVDTSVYSLGLATPKGQRNFFVSMGESTLDSPFPQIQTISARTKFINTFFQNKDGSKINNTFEIVTHILAPFTTDPIISANLDPKSGSGSVIVGAPFLDRNDLEYEKGKYAKRPGLEFILRLRLRQQNLINTYATAGIVFPTAASNTASKSEKISSILGVGISTVDAEKLFGIGLVEFYMVNDLVRTYKGLISIYHKNIKVIEDVSKKIMWIPLPNQGGPEAGTVVSSDFIVPKGFQDSWEIDRRISQLQTKAILAKNQDDIGTNSDGTALSFSDFTISEFQNMADTFDNDLTNANSQKNSLESQGSNALRTIELISGEVSGLGLIDILAIYMTLWSVDIPILLDLIDDQAADRLNKIPELNTAATEARVVKLKTDTKASYNLFVSKIGQILAYGDWILRFLEASPNEGDSGDIARSSA